MPTDRQIPTGLIAPPPSEIWGKLPIYFVENRGQTDPRVAFHARVGALDTWFTGTGVTYALPGPAAASSAQVTTHSWSRDGADTDASRSHRTPPPVRDRWVVRMEFVGARGDLWPDGLDRQEAIYSFFTGRQLVSSPSEWTVGVPTYLGLVYRDVWPGIDVILGQDDARQLKSSFVVRPGHDPSAIRIRYHGMPEQFIDESGRTRMETPYGALIEGRPIAWQIIDGQARSVDVRWSLDAEEMGAIAHASFGVGYFDDTQVLIVDPTLSYAGYVGRSDANIRRGIAVDRSGAAYIAGATDSGESVFPDGDGLGLLTTFDGTYNNGTNDAFVVKINATGTAIVYAGYVGGAGDDRAFAIAVDAVGAAYVTGETRGNDLQNSAFPDGGGFGSLATFDDSANSDYDAFVVKINPSGTALQYAGYIGGDERDIGLGIAVDATGAAIVTGLTASQQSSFPNGEGFSVITTFNGTYGGGDNDAFLAKINPTGSAYMYVGYVGGSGRDDAFAIAVDGTGAAYIAGSANSDQSTFPLPGGFGALTTFDGSYNGGLRDMYVAKINANGTSLSYAGYIGGADEDVGLGIAVDSGGAAYVTGWTRSDQTTFPDGSGVGEIVSFDLTRNGMIDAVAVKINSDGTMLVYVGFIGGASDDLGFGTAIDADGSAYVAGRTQSTQATFPDGDGMGTLTTFDGTHNGGLDDGFVVKISPSGASLRYAGFVGGSGGDSAVGIAVSANGAAFVTGRTFSRQTSFPDGDGLGTLSTFDGTFNGGVDTSRADAFVVRIRSDSKFDGPRAVESVAPKPTLVLPDTRDAVGGSGGMPKPRVP
jgi:hypothetical protein